MKKTYISILSLLFLSNLALAQTLSAKVYLVPWNTLTRASLSAEDVRRVATVKTEITDEHLTNKLINYLHEGIFQKSSSSATADLRLVIDIRLPDGSTESYSSSLFELIEINSAKSRKIDTLFMDHFSTFL
jgi:hypothetical protein